MMGSLPSVIGPYRVIRQLGEGGMGAVFEAVHEVIQRRVAIKVLHPEMGRNADTINRFINEARAANLIGHPGLVQITDFGNLPDGAGYLVMEYLNGQTLEGRLVDSGGKLSPSETVQIGIQIASALATTHKKGIIHRDLKPSNIMLVPDPAMPMGERTKILDFGLAKLAAVREAAMVNTHSQAVLGTPLYMSPEQCQGAGLVDEKTDVYSLGCMLYEMLSGQTPFTGDGPGEVMGKHLFKPPEPLGKLAPAVPAPLAAVVDRLLVKSKEQRLAMREVRQELEALAPSLPPPPRREEAEGSGVLNPAKMAAMRVASTLGQGAAETKEGAKPRRQTAIRVVAACCLVGTLGGGLILTHTQDSPPSSKPGAEDVRATVKPPMSPQRERTIHWSIVSAPSGAALVDEQGVLLGETPWTLERPTGRGTQTVRLRKSGYGDKMLILKLDADEERNVNLEPLQGSSLRKNPASTPPSPKSPPTSRRKKDLYID